MNLIRTDPGCRILLIICSLKCNFIAFKVSFISMKIYTIVTDVVMTLVVPPKVLYKHVVITLF